MEIIVGNKSVNNIINTIEKTHPMKKPRIDVDEEPSKLPEMEIILRIFTEGNKLTAVTILDGNGVYKKGIPESKLSVTLPPLASSKIVTKALYLFCTSCDNSNDS